MTAPTTTTAVAATGADEAAAEREPGSTPPAPIRLATRPVAAVLGALARLRSGPAIHTVGTSYAARLEVRGADATGRRVGLPFVDEPGRYEAVVRLSRGGGLPLPAPDVLGFALRVDGERSADEPQDLLLDSCWASPLGRHLVRPGWSVTSGWYGSLVAYRMGDVVAHLAATAEDEGADVGLVAHDGAQGRRFRLLLAEPREQEWTAWATVTLDGPVERPALRFSPGHAGRGIRLRPDATRFRLPSYRASQQQGPFDA